MSDGVGTVGTLPRSCSPTRPDRDRRSIPATRRACSTCFAARRGRGRRRRPTLRPIHPFLTFIRWFFLQVKYRYTADQLNRRSRIVAKARFRTMLCTSAMPAPIRVVAIRDSARRSSHRFRYRQHAGAGGDSRLAVAAGWSLRPVPLLGDESVGFEAQGGSVVSVGNVGYGYLFRFGRHLIAAFVAGAPAATVRPDARLVCAHVGTPGRRARRRSRCQIHCRPLPVPRWRLPLLRRPHWQMRSRRAARAHRRRTAARPVSSLPRKLHRRRSGECIADTEHRCERPARRAASRPLRSRPRCRRRRGSRCGCRRS